MEKLVNKPPSHHGRKRQREKHYGPADDWFGAAL